MTVTAAYKFNDGTFFFHQMNLDRVEHDEYYLSNTLHEQVEKSQQSPLIRIDRQKSYVNIWDQSDKPIKEQNQTTPLKPINQITPEEWYLWPFAYEIVLVPY